jgi:prepilin-type N-terminal cleavage/methylation domain-containing protein/prepilin-type processing-associated H-X9-DG protein
MVTAGFVTMTLLKKYKFLCSSRRAFTLIELLVVIGIIALLMSIVVPALSRAHKYAKKTVCASNMGQIAIAMQAYVVDNQGRIIQAREILFVHSLQEALSCWNIALLPYIGKNVNNNVLENQAVVWLCPEDKDPYPQGFMNCPHDGMTSYALNGYFEETGDGIKLGPAGGYTFDDIRQPSDCFLLGETSYAAHLYDADAQSVAIYDLPRYGHYRTTGGFYHNNSMNLLYVDGHIESIKGKKTHELVWPEGFESLYQSGKYMYWPDLTLPSASEAPDFWGPGY